MDTGAESCAAESTEGDGKPEKRKRGGSRPWTATVFHVSQTDPIH